jgi:hypothetical protein
MTIHRVPLSDFQAFKRPRLQTHPFSAPPGPLRVRKFQPQKIYQLFHRFASKNY